MKCVHPGVRKVMVEVSEVISAIVDQYEFDFGLDGAICRFSYQHGKRVFDVSKEAKAGVEQLFKRTSPIREAHRLVETRSA